MAPICDTRAQATRCFASDRQAIALDRRHRDPVLPLECAPAFDRVVRESDPREGQWITCAGGTQKTGPVFRTAC